MLDTFRLRCGAHQATVEIARVRHVAVIVADRLGTVVRSSPVARGLLPGLAEAGRPFLGLLLSLGLDPMDLTSSSLTTKILQIGEPSRPYLCDLLRQSQKGGYGWILVLQPLPQTARDANEPEPDVSIAELAAGAAHEIRNPLSAVRGILEDLSESPEDPIERIATALREIARIDELLRELTALTHPLRGQRMVLDLRSVLQEMAASAEAMLAIRGQRLRTDPGPVPIRCEASALELHQVLLNLVRNASEATPEGGEIAIRAQRLPHECRIEVSDTGTGFPETVLPHVFEPFFTTKPSGTGLGLAICRRLVLAHGGDISAENAPDGGRVVIRLPPADQA